MPEPTNLKIATDYVRLACREFAIRYTPEVDRDLAELGLNLTDLVNVLRYCRVTWSDKTEASNAVFEITGETTEDMMVTMVVTIDANCREIVVKEVL